MVCTLIVDIFLFSFIEFFLLKSDLVTVNKILVPFLAIRVLTRLILLLPVYVVPSHIISPRIPLRNYSEYSFAGAHFFY